MGKLIEKIRQKKGTPQRKYTNKEIQERLIYSLINEGMHCLEEGIAQRPMDIDIILIFGYGFPTQRGGPMFYCDEVGLKNVQEKISEYQKELSDNPFWKPSSLLNKCSKTKVGIYKY